MIFKYLAFVFIIVSCYRVGAADFEGKTRFSHYDLEGRFQVTCSRGTERDSAYHQCSGYVLEPMSWAYFSHPQQEMQIDRVQLSTVNSKGKIINKKSNWDSAHSRSSSKFNLWVETVFQKPLLKLGVNEVSYTLSQRGQTIEEGTFTVQVDNGGVRHCATRFLNTSDMRMCDSYSYACSAYFDAERNCLDE